MEIGRKIQKFLLEKLYMEIESLEDKLKKTWEIAEFRAESIKLLEDKVEKVVKALDETNKVNSKLETDVKGLQNAKIHHTLELQKRNADINAIHIANAEL
ncbi:MAG: hypothetical protein ACRDAS_08135, partial [Cetobacterium sp.]